MSLFGKDEVRNFSSIVAPLKEMEANLSTYIDEQKCNQEDLEAEKSVIDRKIDVSKSEQSQSEHTVAKIADFIGSDLKNVSETV